MKKQIQKHGLVMKALMLTLGTFSCTALCADWGVKSLDDEVDWIVEHEQELTEEQLDEKMAALPKEYQEKLVAQLNDKMVAWLMRRGDGVEVRHLAKGLSMLPEEYKEKFVALLLKEVNDLTKNGKQLLKDDTLALMDKISILPQEYREKFYDQLSAEEIEALISRSFRYKPTYYRLNVATWWNLDKDLQKECFDALSGDDQREIRKQILEGDLALKVRYFRYLYEQDQKRIWAEELDPTLKALCFKYFCVNEQERIWKEEFDESPYLKAICFGSLRRPLRQLFWNDLDEASKEKYLQEGQESHHRSTRVGFQSALPDYQYPPAKQSRRDPKKTVRLY